MIAILGWRSQGVVRGRREVRVFIVVGRGSTDREI